jgi:hypothetical protein
MPRPREGYPEWAARSVRHARTRADRIRSFSIAVAKAVRVALTLVWNLSLPAAFKPRLGSCQAKTWPTFPATSRQQNTFGHVGSSTCGQTS